MKLEYIEIGEIVNTHGVRGEMKLAPRDIDPHLLCRCKTVYIDGAARALKSARVHTDSLLFQLPGVTDMDTALTYKGKTVSIRRSDVTLPEGTYFPAELMGMTVQDAETGETLGKISDVVPYPGHTVYEVRGKKEFMVPAVPAFVASVDLEQDLMKIHVWEGLI